MNKESFILYNSFYEPIKVLKNEQLGKLFRAIFNYTINGEITQDNEILVAFMFIKNQLDLDTKKWEESKQQRSEAGKKGMEKRWGKQNNNVINDITNDNTVINDITKITVNDNVNVNVNDNVNDNIYNIDRLGQNDTIDDTKMTYEDRFNKLWDIFPRKEGKANAFKKYQRICKNVDDETIRNGILKYTKYIQENKIEKKYIKQGATWFNGECWNDEYNLGGDTSASGYSRI